jgi:hypothetical protein
LVQVRLDHLDQAVNEVNQEHQDLLDHEVKMDKEENLDLQARLVEGVKLVQLVLLDQVGLLDHLDQEENQDSLGRLVNVVHQEHLAQQVQSPLLK